MLYSLPYIIIISTFGLFSFLHERLSNTQAKRDIVIASIAIFYIFFAFRGYLYTDWTSYDDFFSKLEWRDLSTDENKADFHEPGFVLLALLCKSIINEYAFLVIVCTTIDTFLFVRFLKRREIANIPLVFMLFITFEGLIIMFNLLRNAISIFIFLNSLEYIEKRNIKKYLIACLLCLSFHLSSIIYFPLYFVLHKKLNRWVLPAIFTFCRAVHYSKVSFIGTMASMLGFQGAIGKKVETYTEFFSASRQFSFTGTIEKVGLTTLIFLYYNEISEKKGRILMINCLTLYYIMYYCLGELNTLSQRLADIFIFSYWILWGDIIHAIYLKNNKLILSGILYLYCLLVAFSNIKTPCQEYDNLLFGGKSKEVRRTILQRTYKEDE